VAVDDDPVAVVAPAEDLERRASPPFAAMGTSPSQLR